MKRSQQQNTTLQNMRYEIRKNSKIKMGQVRPINKGTETLGF